MRKIMQNIRHPPRQHELDPIHINNLPPLTDLDHQVGIDHTDHLPDVWPLYLPQPFCDLKREKNDGRKKKTMVKTYTASATAFGWGMTNTPAALGPYNARYYTAVIYSAGVLHNPSNTTPYTCLVRRRTVE